MFSDEIVYFELITLFNDSFYDLKKNYFQKIFILWLKKNEFIFRKYHPLQTVKS